MTNSPLFGRRAAQIPSVPRGEVLGAYDTYLEAQQVVDRLAKAEFDVAKLAIVGSDLKTVERVTGRLTYARAAMTGAASGAWFGLFIGLILILFSPSPNLSFVAAGALIGVGFGVLFGVVSYTLQRRRRDFMSTQTVLASRYEIIIEPTLAVSAREVLARTPAP